jgi:hypothetical protein
VKTADLSESTGIVSFWQKCSDVYPKLVVLVKTLMTFPHSNASSERLFSVLKKIHTEQRDNLCHDTLKSLLSFKINCHQCCYDQELSSQKIRRLKKSTWAYNQKHVASATASSSHIDKVVVMEEDE